MAKKEECECKPMHKPQCMGTMLLIVGILVVLNSMYGWLSWGMFIGGLIALKGIMMFLHPCCKK